MDAYDWLARNRVVLCHFDTYSAALLFARWDGTLLAPAALPASAAPMAAPDAAGVGHDGVAVMQAACERYGLNADELVRLDDFDAWMQTDDGPLRVHVLRFDTFEAPGEAIAPHGGRFQHLTQLRGSPMIELDLLRQVFNLMVGGSR